METDYIQRGVTIEFYDKHMRLVKRSGRLLEPLQITEDIDNPPTTSITIPIEDLPDDNSRWNGKVANLRLFNIVLHINNKYHIPFIVDQVAWHHDKKTVTLDLSHRWAEHRLGNVPLNLTVKAMLMPRLFSNLDFALDGWKYNFDWKANDTKIEYTFSSDNKLEAIENALNNTEDIHVRTDLTKLDLELDFGVFGELQQNILIGMAKPTDSQGRFMENIVGMLSEPEITENYTDTFNRAVILAGDVGAGVNALTLKHIYDNPSLQSEGFPVGRYDTSINAEPSPEYDEDGKTINNEKIYTNNDIIAYAPNVNREYYITNTAQLDTDGQLNQTSHAFSDLYPIPSTDEIITDSDRVEIVKRAYARGVRLLKSQSSVLTYQFNCTELPSSVKIGNKLRFAYDGVDEVLYLTSRTITFSPTMAETNTVTLDTELRVNPIEAVALELAKKAKDDASSKTSSASGGSASAVSGSDSGFGGRESYYDSADETGYDPGGFNYRS